MPIITDISPQKNQDFYNLFIDGTFACGVAALELSSRGLKVGQELTSREVKQLMEDSIGSKAYNAALRYLSYRPRSEYEVRTYLASKEYESGVVDVTISRLRKAKFIDDEAFARSWVHSRQTNKPRARSVLAKELMAKRINKDTINQVLQDEVDAAAEISSLAGIATKKLKLARFKQDKQKLTQYLLSQGFRYGDIKQVLSDLTTENDKA